VGYSWRRGEGRVEVYPQFILFLSFLLLFFYLTNAVDGEDDNIDGNSRFPNKEITISME
jgi:hypothetical protein